ncbi:MAG: TIGR02147 family protein [Bdellovibrionales bacterium]
MEKEMQNELEINPEVQAPKMKPNTKGATNGTAKSTTKGTSEASVGLNSPRVFDYIDHKIFLQDYYNYKKNIDANFSYGVFARKARLQARNYLKRIIDGDRPVTSELLPRIAEVIGLNGQESLYFESMVRFTQTIDQSAKAYYFQQLRSASSGVKSSIAELVNQQFEVLSDWFYIPLWEYCELTGKTQAPEKVSRAFRGRLTATEVKKAFQKLSDIGLLKIDPTTGRYIKAQKMIQYHQDTVNLAVREFHQKMLDLTKVAIENDGLEDRYVRALSVAVSESEVNEMRTKIDEFFKNLNIQFSNSKNKKEIVMQVNIQSLNMTKSERE